MKRYQIHFPNSLIALFIFSFALIGAAENWPANSIASSSAAPSSSSIAHNKDFDLICSIKELKARCPLANIAENQKQTFEQIINLLELQENFMELIAMDNFFAKEKQQLQQQLSELSHTEPSQNKQRFRISLTTKEAQQFFRTNHLMNYFAKINPSEKTAANISKILDQHKNNKNTEVQCLLKHLELIKNIHRTHIERQSIVEKWKKLIINYAQQIRMAKTEILSLNSLFCLNKVYFATEKWIFSNEQEPATIEQIEQDFHNDCNYAFQLYNKYFKNDLIEFKKALQTTIEKSSRLGNKYSRRTDSRELRLFPS